MAERTERPEGVPETFEDYRCISDLAKYMYPTLDLAGLEDYIGWHLDFGNEEGERNLESFLQRLEELRMVLAGRCRLAAPDAHMLEGIRSVSGLTTIVVPSEAHRQVLERGWDQFLANLRVTPLGAEILNEIEPIADKIKFDEQHYEALFSHLNEEPPEAEEPKEENEEEIEVEEPTTEEGPSVPPADGADGTVVEFPSPPESAPEPNPEPSPEPASVSPLDSLRSGMTIIMATAPHERAEQLGNFLAGREASEIQSMCRAIDFRNPDELSQGRDHPTGEARATILALLGFSEAPEPRVFFVRLRVLSGLLDQIDSAVANSIEPQINAFSRALTNSFALTMDTMPATDADLNTALASADSMNMQHYNRYFNRQHEPEAGAELTGMSLDRLAQELNRVLFLPMTSKTIEMRKLMERIDEDTLRSLLAPLLATNMQDATEFRQTPGNESVRNVILKMCGFSTPPRAQVMFKRIRDLMMLFEDVLNMPDLSSVAGAREAINRGSAPRSIPAVDLYGEVLPLALMHIVPESFLENISQIPQWAPQSVQEWATAEAAPREEGRITGRMFDRARARVDAATHPSPDDRRYWRRAKRLFGSAAGAAAAIGGLGVDAARAGAEVGRRGLGWYGSSISWNLYVNRIRDIRDYRQYDAFFGVTSASGNAPTEGGGPQSPAPNQPEESNNTPGSPGSPGGPNGPEQPSSLLTRASEAVDRIAGREVPGWAKNLGFIIVGAAGAEWAIRGVGTVGRRVYNGGKEFVNTGVNVVATPLSWLGKRTKEMWNRGWGAIKPAERAEIPENSPWYQRWAHSSWYRASWATRGVSAFALGSTLAIGGVMWGAAEGTALAATEAIGLRYNDIQKGSEPTVDEIVKALDGKVSEDALRGIAEATEPSEALEKAIAELGEGGAEILEKAGLMSSKDPRSIADRFSLVKDSGLLAMGREFLGGAKELAVDNTVKALKLTGTRKAVEGAAGLVLGNFKIPTLGELSGFRTTLEELGPKLQANYEASTNTGFARYLEAAGKLSKGDLKKGLDSVITTFDLDEGGGVRAGIFGVAPSVINLAADIVYPERKFEAKYGKGVGPWLAELVKGATVQVSESDKKAKAGRDRQLGLLSGYLADPATLDKLIEEHEFLASVNLEDLRIRLQNGDSRQYVKSHLAKFMGVSKVTEATAPVYLRRIVGAKAAFESLDDPVAKGFMTKLFGNVEGLLSSGENGLLHNLFPQQQRRTGTTG